MPTVALRARKLGARRPHPPRGAGRTGPMTRSSCSTWARSPSSGRTGARRWAACAAAWRGSAPSDSITRKLFALIARAHQMLGEPARGAGGLRRGAGARPRGRRAVVPQGGGPPAAGRVGGGASGAGERILTLHAARAVRQRGQGIYGHLTRRNLAALAAERGDRDEEARLWRAVLAECPGDREALAKLRQPGPAESTR